MVKDTMEQEETIKQTKLTLKNINNEKLKTSNQIHKGTSSRPTTINNHIRNNSITKLKNIN